MELDSEICARCFSETPGVYSHDGRVYCDDCYVVVTNPDAARGVNKRAGFRRPKPGETGAPPRRGRSRKERPRLRRELPPGVLLTTPRSRDYRIEGKIGMGWQSLIEEAFDAAHERFPEYAHMLIASRREDHLELILPGISETMQRVMRRTFRRLERKSRSTCEWCGEYARRWSDLSPPRILCPPDHFKMVDDVRS